MTMGEAFWAHETACVDDPSAIGEGTRVWHFSHIAKGASVGARCSIGQNVYLASGAVVTRDVPDFSLVTGNPGRQQGWMCRCGIKLKLPVKGGRTRVSCQVCGAGYRRSRAGLVEAEGA